MDRDSCGLKSCCYRRGELRFAPATAAVDSHDGRPAPGGVQDPRSNAVYPRIDLNDGGASSRVRCGPERVHVGRFTEHLDRAVAAASEGVQ